jgi:hypothetical protein
MKIYTPFAKLKSPESRQIAELIDELRFKIPATEEWEALTEVFFDRLAEYLGQYQARRIFNKCAPPITKREAQLENSAMLLYRYISMKPKRSVARLVRQLAGEDGSDKDAITQRIWRAINSKTAYGRKVQAYLQEELFERGITIRTKDKSGKMVDTLVGDMVDAGLTLRDVLFDMETSLHDIFD